MEGIRQRCVEIFVKTMEAQPQEIVDDSSPETLEGWDSLSHTRLILELEAAFSVEISPDESLELQSFKAIVDSIAKKKGQ